MAKLRKRAKRSFYLLIALCVLALLLQLNQFLPGDWAGGGGGGFRAAHTLGTGAPDRDDRDASQDERPDETVVLPPEQPPEAWPPREGVRVELRGPDGDLETRWRMGAGTGGDEVEPDGRGVARTNTAQVFEEGFRLVTTKGLLRHAHGLGDRAAKWVVQRPDGKLPSQRAPGRAGVRVIDALTKKPIAGAKVEWRAGGRRHDAVSDATGEAVVRGEPDGKPVRVEVTAHGRETVTVWVSPRSPKPASVPLDELVSVTADLVLPPGTTADQVTLTVLTNIRTFGFHQPLASGAGVRPRARVPRRALDGAWLEATVQAEHGRRFVVRSPVRVPSTRLEIPAGRTLRVRAVDDHRRSVEGSSIRARYPTDPGRASEERYPFPLGISGKDSFGTHYLAVPRGVPVRLLVQAPGMEPLVRTLTPIDGTDTMDFVMERGLEVPILVQGADGRPLPGARILARASLDGVRVSRNGETDAKGEAGVGPFGPGPVEIFAVADGHACTAMLADARPAMGTVKVDLRRGYPLTLVVEDPYGIPLAGVAVTVTPADGGLPLVSEPDAGDWRTDENGRLRIERLPNRLYDVGLSLPGHKHEKLRKVQPGAVTYFATLLSD